MLFYVYNESASALEAFMDGNGRGVHVYIFFGEGDLYEDEDEFEDDREDDRESDRESDRDRGFGNAYPLSEAFIKPNARSRLRLQRKKNITKKVELILNLNKKK